MCLKLLKKINFLLLNFSYSFTKITDFLELDICDNGLRIKKDYLKYMGSDNEIVRGNESKMNYLMTIKKEEQYRPTIYEDDNGYYKVLYIQTLSLPLLSRLF